jgi:hypothetical protein
VRRWKNGEEIKLARKKEVRGDKRECGRWDQVAAGGGGHFAITALLDISIS